MLVINNKLANWIKKTFIPTRIQQQQQQEEENLGGNTYDCVPPMAPNIDHLYANTQVVFRSKYLYKNKMINLFADDGRGGEKEQKGESESDHHSSEERESIGETNEFLSYPAT